MQKVNTNQLVKVFDPKQNESKLNVFGQQFEQVLGEGGGNKQGNTKVFATENLSKQAIFDYAISYRRETINRSQKRCTMDGGFK